MTSSIKIPNEFRKKSVDGFVDFVLRKAEDEKDKEKIIKPKKKRTLNRPFLLEYDEFGKELITKLNEKYNGSILDISYKNNGLVSCIDIFKRAALTTIIAQDAQLRSAGFWPITPLESEKFLKKNWIPQVNDFEEYLGLILYDTKGVNQKEAKELLNNINCHRQELGLSKDDLEKRLFIVNVGVEEDFSMPYEFKFVILPGISEVYVSEVLNNLENFDKIEKRDHHFSWGLEDNGLPKLNQLRTRREGRTFKVPSSYCNPFTKDFGLRVLQRFNSGISLNADKKDLSYWNYDDFRGNITFFKKNYKMDLK